MSISDLSVTSDKNELPGFGDYVRPLDYLALSWVAGALIGGGLFVMRSHPIFRVVTTVSGVALWIFVNREYQKAIDKIYDRSTWTWRPSNVGTEIKESIQHVVESLKEKLHI